MTYTVMITASLQVLGDLSCFLLATYLAFSKKVQHRTFFILNAVAFSAALFVDSYYNYIYRYLHFDIHGSLSFIITLPLLLFQLIQAYNWSSLIDKKFSIYNLPYLLFTVLLCCTLIYYFLVGHNPSKAATYLQSASVTFNMLVWYFAIINLARARSVSIVLLALGCLLIISADLTFRCLFMLDIERVATVQWIHILWTCGVLSMLAGFIFCLRKTDFKFCPADSIQASSCAWLSLTSLTVFIIGFILLFFSFTYTFVDIQASLWGLPIALVFTMITAVLLGNWFSNLILLPIETFLKRIEIFNSGRLPPEVESAPTKLYEIRLLGNFINSSFKKLSTQLDREIKLSAQVAHDIRSPLSALQALVDQQLAEIGEPKRILLREAISQIRDITNNLEKDTLPKEKSVTQMAVLVEHVLSERRVAIANQAVRINQNISVEAYDLFANLIPSEMKRVLTNIINNACEAIKSDDGCIDVDLTCKGKGLIINITDNGVGIAKEKIPSLFERGYTTKVNGTGLGLFHAKECLAAWGGTINISSDVGKGTTVTILLPIEAPPHWYISRLSILANSTLICVDDSISILHAWQERLKSEVENVDLRYCSSKEDLKDELEKQKKKPCTYLVDYEFSGKSYTGLDLIDMILSLKNPENRVFLVTSRSSEVELQRFCSAKGIFMIPKFFALKIPLQIVKKPLQTVVVSSLSNSLEHFFLDPLVNNNSIILYNNVNDFFANLIIFDRTSKIFILRSLVKQSDISEIQKLGFEVITFEDITKVTESLKSQNGVKA